MLTERIALTSLMLTSTVAGLSFFRYEQHRLRARFEARGIRSYRAMLDDADVHYWAGGEGPRHPVLLVHGFGGDALFGWAQQAPIAADRFVIAPDLLWFGDSHDDSEDFSASHQADVLIRLMDHLALERVDIVGISYGGFVTMELVNRYPDRVRRVVMVDSPGHVYTLEDYHAALDRLDIDSIAELVVPDGPVGVRRLMQFAYFIPPPIPMFVARDIYPNLFVKWRAQKVRLLDFLLHLAGEVDASSYHFAHPVLVLWGARDVLFPPSLARRLATAIGPQAEVELIPAANHAPNMERPLRFNRSLRAFLDADDHEDT